MHIRVGGRDELAVLQEIERAAGRWFRDVGMEEIAEDDPPSLETLRGYERTGGLWVVTPGTEDGGDTRDTRDAGGAGEAEGAGAAGEARVGAAGEPVAYALVEAVDDCLHIEQISVHPDSARRGIGRALIEHLAARARTVGAPGLTLTTFAEVPWNAPYYERLGFRGLADHELTPGLREIRRAEKEHGLDRWPRVCMRRDV
ncbi:GNAT family N-acetyltransferase [Streptomyces iconiensis]|uniref:GNAT family N-acetyltransferase n=1 Tax=Streptomyces iconiensis TaxID=1384038 RepID=A0ABT6ZQN3_9ACTN|nr:GNAT family N-acetyltransferase [Streptomyces iconiensis]MDJ1131372.1 GNAT family N-acetyltransferase [Streptomyces iconiensis]